MENNADLNKRQVVPVASAILEDGSILEMTFQPGQRRTFFAMYNAGRWTVQDRIDYGSGTSFVPFSPNNNLIKNEVVLLPTEPLLYDAFNELPYLRLRGDYGSGKPGPSWPLALSVINHFLRAALLQFPRSSTRSMPSGAPSFLMRPTSASAMRKQRS